MKATRAALGFRVKSGWATAVIVGGSSSAPRLCMSEIVNLADPQAPETQQPYHAGFGTLETDEAKLNRRIQGVGRATEKSIVDLVQRRVKNGYAIARAALVVGSVIEPKSIANPHVRAHALEGQLFRTTLEAALQTRGIRCAIFRERDIYALAAKSLRRSPAQIKRALADLGRGEKHWRAEQKSAGLAAWLLL